MTGNRAPLRHGLNKPAVSIAPRVREQIQINDKAMNPEAVLR